MSGFFGMLNLDGAPVDQSLLERLTQTLAFRGPDGQRTWAEGPVGFGHTLFRATWESAREIQPLGRDGVWIVADVRVDGREELARKLDEDSPIRRSRGHETPIQRSDVRSQRTENRNQSLLTSPATELILRAYLKWGEGCVEHLIGDFAFAIWDSRSRKLFCARDHFGVKQFYYAQIGSRLVFSNTLNTLRAHPAVSNRLNEMALGHFLIFDCNWQLDTTFFADIQKLPGAHTLTVSNGQVVRRKYWQLVEPPTLRLKRDEEYLEGFRERLDQAVGDRLQADRVAISFSGGLDSTNMAAAALRAQKGLGRPVQLKAITAVYDQLIPDTERHFSGVAAKALELPIEHVPGDQYQPYAHLNNPCLLLPEPCHTATIEFSVAFNRACAAFGPVMLYGEGGDEILKTYPLRELLPHHPAGELLVDFLGCIARHHFLPPIGSGLLARLRQLRGRPPEQKPTFPIWLRPDAIHRLGLVEQWQDREQWRAGPADALVTPKRRFLTPLWQTIFECYDPGASRVLTAVRLPYLDLRLVQYALSLPPLPWAANKFLLRKLGEQSLPPEITRRPKTGLAASPIATAFAREPARLTALGRKPFSPLLDGLVVREAWQQALATANFASQPLWEVLRVVSLNYWLQHSQVTL